jgi:tape measure domain-containing protein
MARSTQDLSITQNELLDVTNTINKALIISGGSAESMNAALVQLGQGFASGTLRGEELNSVMEQTPRLAQAIAEGMGVSVGKLRALGAEGKITAEAVIKALQSQAKSVNDEFSKMEMTVSQAQTVAYNSMVRLIGSFDQATGASGSLSDAIVSVAKSIDGLSGSIAENQTELDYTVALIKRTVAGFNLLYEVAENTAQNVAHGISALVYGALEPIFMAIAKTTAALNDMGLASNDSLKSSLETQIWIHEQLERNNAAIKGNNQEIADAYAKFGVSLKEHVTLFQEERRISEESNYMQEQKNALLDKQKEKTKEIVVNEKEAQKAREEAAKSLKEFYDDWNKSEAEDREIELEAEKARQALYEEGARFAMELYEERTRLELEYGDLMRDNYIDALDAQIELANSTNEWNDGLTGAAGNIAAISRAMNKVQTDALRATKAQATLDRDYAKNIEKFGKDKVKAEELEAKYVKDSAQIKEQTLQNELQGYSQLAAATSQMFDNNSKEAAAFRVVQDGLALSAAVTAIASSGMGDPYTAIARVVAMTATMSSLLGNIGQTIGVGTNETSTSYDAFAAMEENIGKGTVFGDKDAQSESIANSLDIVSQYAEPQYKAIMDMNRSLLKLSNSIGMVVNQAISMGAIKGDYVPTSSSSSSQDGLLRATLGATVGFGGFGLVAGGIAAAFGLADKIKVDKTLEDYGANINAQLITGAMDSLNATAYDVIKVVTTKKRWYGTSTTNISYSTMQKELDATLSDNISMIFGDIYDSVLTATEAIGFDRNSVIDDLSDFMIEQAKISFNKSGEEIQKDFEAYISSVGDLLSEDALNGLLDPFVKAGEGFLEALARVSTETNVVTKSLDLIGFNLDNSIKKILGTTTKTVDVWTATWWNGTTTKLYEAPTYWTSWYTKSTETTTVATEKLYNQAVTVSNALVTLAGDLDTFNERAGAYYESYFSNEEKIANIRDLMAESFGELGYQAPKTYEQFRAIVESLDITTTHGQQAYTSIISLADVFSIVGDAARQSESNIRSFEDSFKTQEQIVAEMMSEFGYGLSNSMEGLQVLFGIFSRSGGELTDAELEALEANKALIESYEALSETIENNLTSVIEKLRAPTTDAAQSIEKFYDALNRAKMLKGGDLETYSEALNTAIGYSDALMNSENFSLTRDMEFAQLAAAKQFENLKDVSLTQIDYLSMIADNTARSTIIYADGSISSQAVSPLNNMDYTSNANSSLLIESQKQTINLNAIIMNQNTIISILRDSRDLQSSTIEVLEDIERVI